MRITTAKSLKGLWHLYVPLSYLMVVMLFFHSRGRFEFDLDEGINLIKALLVEKGYGLYTQIWSDQPPVLTYLLALGVRLFGYKVGVARSLILAFSMGLLWAAFEFMQLSWKRSSAYAACFLILLLPQFVRLSLSVMVGLPSISFAMGALLCLVLWHQQKKILWLLFSAILLSLAVFTKLMIGFLAPIFGIGLLLEGYKQFRTSQKWIDLFGPAFLWSAVFVIICVGSLILHIQPPHFSQLFGDHIVAPQLQVFTDPRDTINYHLQQGGVPFLFFALVGILFVLKARRWLLLYLIGWALTAYIFLFFYQPVWYHHQLYFTIPVAMLGGIAFVEGVDLFIQKISRQSAAKGWNWIRILTLVCVFSAISLVRMPHLQRYLSWPPSLQVSGLGLGTDTAEVFFKVVEYAPQTQWMATDSPMFAFRAGLSVPPEIAVLSGKRLLTGYLTQEDILEVIQQYQPEQVLLGKYDLPGLLQYIETNYTLLAHKEDDINLYLRNDLLP